jgi:predicted transglutaminase-like cysteine proteinase
VFLSATAVCAAPVRPAPGQPLLTKSATALAVLDQPLRYHQRLFDANEVSFGLPTELVPRAAVVNTALAELGRTAQAFDRRQMSVARAATHQSRAEAWLILLHAMRAKPWHVQLTAVNGFINQQRYVADASGTDTWQTPLHFLAGTGDCEEYAIAKYASFRQLGVPAERLRIVVAHADKRSEYHAVLALYLDDDILIFDNRADLVLPHRVVQDLKPVYSLNENEIWFHWHDGEPAPTVFAPGVMQAASD